MSALDSCCALYLIRSYQTTIHFPSTICQSSVVVAAVVVVVVVVVVVIVMTVVVMSVLWMSGCRSVIIIIIIIYILREHLGCIQSSMSAVVDRLPSLHFGVYNTSVYNASVVRGNELSWTLRCPLFLLSSLPPFFLVFAAPFFSCLCWPLFFFLTPRWPSA